MYQNAPDPTALEDLVDGLLYKPNWRFELKIVDRGQESKGLTLCITITTPDSYHPEKIRGVVHYFIVPAAAYDTRSWRRWLFDRIVDVETHEAMEFFQIDHVRPYAPHHGPGNDPYIIFEHGTDLDVRTAYTGEVNPAR